MATIKPFPAVRPTRDKVSLVASRSYQTYTQAEREARLDYNPFSFLHIVNPGYKYDREITGVERYKLVKNRYQEFKEDHIFVQDKKPCFYIYKIVDRNLQVFHGIVAAASVADYKNNSIKKHEKTLTNRVTVFKDYLKTVGFNAEPVLLSYPDNKSLNTIVEKVMLDRAEFEFTTTYRDTHYLWKIEDEKCIKQIQNIFNDIPNIYVADGHHRSASSVMLSEDMGIKQNTNYQYFMSFLIPESELRIHEFYRVVKTLNGLTKEAFLIALDENFRIENHGKSVYKPTKKHHFNMYLDGEFYSLYLRKSKYKFNNSLDSLDTQILFKTILQPILGIQDLCNSKQIAYINAKKDIVQVVSKIDQGDYAVGFGMLPITINEIKKIADENLQMPPKSTYIEPKLRSGVTIYEF